MIPLQDLTPRRSFPVVTLSLILVNIIVLLYQICATAARRQRLHHDIRSRALQNSASPGGTPLHDGAGARAAFTCMFLHGGWLHIIGNMWFLWIFGANVEDRMGPIAYLLFYLVCGIGSSVAQTLFSWGSHIPSLGASGAISGVLGAYIIFFPGSQISTLVTLFIIWFRARIPAMVFIGLWFVMQFLSGIGSLGTTGASASGGVAWWAHVGGFLLGMLIAFIMSLSTRSAARG